MSTSLMYHAFGARNYKYLRTEYRSGCIYFHIEKKPQHQRCVACGSRHVTLGGRQAYELRSLPIGGKRTFLVLHLHVLDCKSCGARRQESRDLADPRKTYTRAFARYVLYLTEKMSLKAVAEHLRAGWDLVKGILKERLEKKARHRRWGQVRRIAIGEFALRKGHHYMTVVLDLDTGQILFAAEGRDKKTLVPFFRRLARTHSKLEAIAMDMSGPYAAAVREYGPKSVAVVHDHYHIVSAMNAVIDHVRRDEQNRLSGEGKKVIKGSRYLLLKGREKLNESPESRSRLDALLKQNETLHAVYLLKEDLRLFWRQPSKEAAGAFVSNWIDEALSLRNRHVTTLARTLRRRLAGILAWYDHPISTGPLEGVNNKIKVMKRVAYGYRDTRFFILRLLFLHETKLRLSGV